MPVDNQNGAVRGSVQRILADMGVDLDHLRKLITEADKARRALAEEFELNEEMMTAWPLFSKTSTVAQKKHAARELAKRLPLPKRNPLAWRRAREMAVRAGKRGKVAAWVRSEILVPAIKTAAKQAHTQQRRIAFLNNDRRYDVYRNAVPMNLPLALALRWLCQRALSLGEALLAPKARKRKLPTIVEFTELDGANSGPSGALAKLTPAELEVVMGMARGDDPETILQVVNSLIRQKIAD